MWDRLPTKSWRKWLLSFGVWTLIGLAFASQFNFTQSRRGYLVTWKFALSTTLADWYVFALLSIPAWWLARHFRLEGARWRRSLAVHLAAAAAFSVLWVALRVCVEWVRSLGHTPYFYFAEMFRWTLAKTFYFNLLVYGVIVGVSHAFEYYRKYREREWRAAELERRLAEARLQALQAQLNPHFLFNTLHAISSLLHRDVDAADRMIVRLGELLRHALEQVGTQEVPLRKELAFLESYLEIEQTRFGERLTIRQDIGPEALDALVPNLVLQPLVENAIRHGIEPHAKPGWIELRARRQDEILELQVRDSGLGLPAGPLDEGVGLSNTRARLQQLYGAGHRMDLVNSADGGLVVTVRLPWRVAATGAEAPPATRAMNA